MIEDLRNKLPEELVWNVLKYTEHPCATIMKEGFNTDPYIRCGFCVKVVFLDTGNWSCKLTDDIICGACYLENKEELERIEAERYSERVAEWERLERLALLEELERVEEWEPDSEEEWEHVD